MQLNVYSISLANLPATPSVENLQNPCYKVGQTGGLFYSDLHDVIYKSVQSTSLNICEEQSQLMQLHSSG
jgi:hypothetical protein